MTRPVIVEILGRAVQGKSEPFICVADDGHTYYVKGLHAGRESQIREWLCAKLAQALGLPIAPFAVVEVPEALARARLVPSAALLGAGAAFGSRKVDTAVWFNRSHLGQVPLVLQRAVLAFDWWVRNADRSLTIHGGNPNLLWNTSAGELAVIDHNLAFDADFDARGFFDTHVFSGAAPGLIGDLWHRAEVSEWLLSALDVWADAVAELPSEWRYNDPEETLPCQFDLSAAHRLLQRAARDDFWSTGT